MEEAEEFAKLNVAETLYSIRKLSMRLYQLLEITVLNGTSVITVLKTDMPDVIMAVLLRHLRNQGFKND